MVRKELTLSALTGISVGSKKITEMKMFQAHAKIFSGALKGPRCHGPLSNRPKHNLHMIGMTYDKFSATEHTLNTALIAV